MADGDSNLAALRQRLRELHRAAGQPTLRQLKHNAELAGLKLATSTAHELLAGRRCPRWTTIEAYVRAAISHAQSRRPPAPVPAHLRDLQSWRLAFERATDGEAGRPMPTARASNARTTYLSFVLALDSAHQALRGVARSPLPQPDRTTAADGAVHDSLLYARREELLVLGALPVVVAGERAFLQLIAIRDVVRAGARLDSIEYHRPYHKFAEALWAMRVAVRAELGRPAFTPGALDRADWADYERCADCPPPDS
jgi:hypothetical protein